MQDRELNYFNRMKFIGQLYKLESSSPSNYYPSKNLPMGFSYYETAETYVTKRMKLLDILTKLTTRIYNNETYYCCSFNRLYPTGNYFTDLMVLLLWHGIDNNGQSKLFEISEHTIDHFTFYTKNMSVNVFEKIMDYSIAIFQIETANHNYYYYFWYEKISKYISSYIRNMEKKIKIVNVDVPIYVPKKGYDCYLVIDEDGAIKESNLISTPAREAEYDKFVNNVGLYRQEISDLIEPDITLFELYNRFRMYKEELNMIKNGPYILNIGIDNDCDSKYSLSISGTFGYKNKYSPKSLIYKQIAYKYHKTEVEEAVDKCVKRWANKSAGLKANLPEAVRIFNSDIARINKSIEVNGYAKFKIQYSLSNSSFEYLKYDRHFVKIGRISYEREPENTNTKTFDFIRVEVLTAALNKYDLYEWAKKFKDTLISNILKKLESDKRFIKYGVPINFLRLDNIIITNDCLVVFMFELKQIHGDNEDSKQ
jgi:hypothetical protein